MQILFRLVSIAFLLTVSGCISEKNQEVESSIPKKGVVVYPSDLTSIGSEKWVKMARDAGINVIGIHSDTFLETVPKLKGFLESQEGTTFLSACMKYGVEVEYEMHILKDLLPRELFKTHPEYFRMDKDGDRNPDFNMCFTADMALEIVKKNAVELAKWLKPTTHRYFFWVDDRQEYCHCDKCKQYSPSEQVLLYENALLKGLRTYDAAATVAHLAYVETIIPPEKVKPLPGVFLEFAPINRDYTELMSETQINNLKRNLEVFPSETAHILEYWLDVSKFSGWKRENLTQPPWNQHLFAKDVQIYSDEGVQSITTFAAWINADYVKKFGGQHTIDLLNNYGEMLNSL